MAGIDLGTIQQDLARRFAAPLPEFYKRRIIFWYDEDREFEDQLEDLSLDGVEVLVLTGNNTFTVKKQLCEDESLFNKLNPQLSETWEKLSSQIKISTGG